MFVVIQLYLKMLLYRDRIDRSEIVFITGNVNKVAEVQQMLPTDLKLTVCQLEIPEVQGATVGEVAQAKSQDAFQRCRLPVLIEDSGLCMSALNGLPGPYIKWFHTALGDTGTIRLLHGYRDKSATAECVFVYRWGSKSNECLVATGKVHGQIVAKPRGTNGFGWDTIFQPAHSSQTFAEMTSTEKNQYSARSQALTQLMTRMNNMKNEYRLLK